MLSDFVNQLKDLVHGGPVGGMPWLEGFVLSAIDFVTGPLINTGNRFYWVGVATSVVVAGLVFVFREKGTGLRGFVRYCFPKRFFTHPSTLVDVKLIAANHFLSRFFNVTWRLNGALMTGWLLGVLVWAFGPAPHLFRWNAVSLVVITILIGMMEDLGYYLLHLAQHKTPWLWAFHKVHHSAEVLTPLVAGRVHPVEMALIGPARAAATSLLLAPTLYLFMDEPTLVQVFGMGLMAAFVASIGNQLLHSHIWLSWGRVLEHVLISPAQHQVHHSIARQHWDKNMGGIFALWDWMFGTLYVMGEREYFTFGLGEKTPQIHTGFITGYLVPFLDFARCFWPAKRPVETDRAASADVDLVPRLTPARPDALPALGAQPRTG